MPCHKCHSQVTNEEMIDSHAKREFCHCGWSTLKLKFGDIWETQDEKMIRLLQVLVCHDKECGKEYVEYEKCTQVNSRFCPDCRVKREIKANERDSLRKKRERRINKDFGRKML